MRRRWVWGLVAALGLIGVVGAVWIGRDGGWVEMPGTTPLLLVDPSPTHLDTLAIDGRRITATLDGVVRQIDEDGLVWVEWDGDGFSLRHPHPDSLQVEDRALAVGRLRQWRGRRWLEVEAWTPVTSSVR